LPDGLELGEELGAIVGAKDIGFGLGLPDGVELGETLGANVGTLVGAKVSGLMFRSGQKTVGAAVASEPVATIGGSMTGGARMGGAAMGRLTTGDVVVGGSAGVVMGGATIGGARIGGLTMGGAMMGGSMGAVIGGPTIGALGTPVTAVVSNMAGSTYKAAIGASVGISGWALTSLLLLLNGDGDRESVRMVSSLLAMNPIGKLTNKQKGSTRESPGAAFGSLLFGSKDCDVKWLNEVMNVDCAPCFHVHFVLFGPILWWRSFAKIQSPSGIQVYEYIGS
jgi:hypothetical protein